MSNNLNARVLILRFTTYHFRYHEDFLLTSTILTKYRRSLDIKIFLKTKTMLKIEEKTLFKMDRLTNQVAAISSFLCYLEKIK